jgi:hypothetical protein
LQLLRKQVRVTSILREGKPSPQTVQKIRGLESVLDVSLLDL